MRVLASNRTAAHSCVSARLLLLATQVNGKALTKLNVPCQDRKRLLKMAHKVKQGWVHDGKPRSKHHWKGYKPPEWLPGGDRGIPGLTR